MNLYQLIENSFPKIEAFFPKAKLWEFSHTPRHDLEQYNFGLGTMIRLKLLRPKSTLYKEFVQEGFIDRDEMSMEMIREFYKYIRYKT